MQGKHAIIPIVLLLLSILTACASLSREEIQAAQQAEFVSTTLRAVCNERGVGQKVEGAGSYDPASEFHPMLVALAGEWPEDLELVYEDSWKPQEISEAQLVTCIYPEERGLVENCSYGFASFINRYLYGVRIEVFDPRTGEMLFATSKWGSIPESCPGYISTKYKYPDIYGSHVLEVSEDGNKISLNSDIHAFLEGIVMGVRNPMFTN
jgi:hypothetical protein